MPSPPPGSARARRRPDATHGARPRPECLHPSRSAACGRPSPPRRASAPPPPAGATPRPRTRPRARCRARPRGSARCPRVPDSCRLRPARGWSREFLQPPPVQRSVGCLTAVPVPPGVSHETPSALDGAHHTPPPWRRSVVLTAMSVDASRAAYPYDN